MADSRFEELDHRVRELANEVEGEKMITRHVLDQCLRNGAEIAAVRVELKAIGLRIDNLAGDVTAARAALNRLNIVSQDVTMLRGEIIEIRRDMVTMREDMDAMRGRVDMIGEQVGTMRGDMDTIREQVGTMRGDMDAIREQVGTMRGDMDAMREEAAARHHALLAAIHELAAGRASPA